METRACGNPYCEGAELISSYSNGFMNFYCGCCGYEEKEASAPPPPKRSLSYEERKKELGATVTSIMSAKTAKQKQAERAKVKQMRDRENYVPRRGSR